MLHRSKSYSDESVIMSEIFHNDDYVDMESAMAETDTPQDHRVRVAADRRKRMLAQLSAAALRVMARAGVEGTTIDAIIQEAGVSRGTFYKYYDAPSDLIRAVGAELAEDLIRAVSPTLQSLDDPAARLASGFRMILRLAEENPLLARFLVHAGWPATDHVPAFSERVGANIAAGIAQGRFTTSQMVSEAMVGGLLMGVVAATLTGRQEQTLHFDATKALLLGVGLGSDEAEAFASMPLEPSAPLTGGLLERCC